MTFPITSGTYSFVVQASDIIRQAMLNIKRLDAEEVPTTQETTDCLRVLNMMCKQWMGKSDFAPGLKIWTRKRGYMLLNGQGNSRIIGTDDGGIVAKGWSNDLTVTTLAATAAASDTSISVSDGTGFATSQVVAIELDAGYLFYTTASSVSGTTVGVGALPSQASAGNAVFTYTTAAQNPRTIETALLRDQSFSDTPLQIIRDVKTYDLIPNKADVTNVGDPSVIYVEAGLWGSTVYTDVGACQDVGKYIVITFLEPVQDFNTSADYPYYPQEWYLALCWGLTEQIAPMFGGSWNDKMESLKNNAIAIARNTSSEISELYFQPGNE